MKGDTTGSRDAGVHPVRRAGCDDIWVTTIGQKQTRDQSFHPRILRLAFKLHPAILKPGFYLALGEVEQGGQAPLLAGADVALLAETPLQLLQLRRRELGAGPPGRGNAAASSSSSSLRFGAAPLRTSGGCGTGAGAARQGAGTQAAAARAAELPRRPRARRLLAQRSLPRRPLPPTVVTSAAPSPAVPARRGGRHSPRSLGRLSWASRRWR